MFQPYMLRAFHFEGNFFEADGADPVLVAGGGTVMGTGPNSFGRLLGLKANG